VDFLVAEETVGYGLRLEVDSTSARHLNLVPLMHQIRLGLTGEISGTHSESYKSTGHFGR
jgi:hypothetical protein